MNLIQTIYFGKRKDLVLACQGMKMKELRLVVRCIKQARFDRHEAFFQPTLEKEFAFLWECCLNAQSWYNEQKSKI